MKDEKTKQKEKQLIEMVSSFCMDNLNEEYEQLSIKLVEKMGRKHNVPFKRGKLENWASGIIYAIAQINFLFDKSQELHTSPDEICDFFNTKKSTASNKARDIRYMFNMGHFDEEFSAKSILDNAPKFYIDEKTGFIIPENFVETNPMDDFFDEVYELFEEGNSEKALEMLDSVPEDSPEYARALFYKSVIIGSSDDMDEGFEYLKQALMAESGEDMDFSVEYKEVDFSDYIDLFDIGVLKYQNDEFEEAVEFLDLALDIEPEFSEALYYKSLSLAGMGEFKKAVDVLDKAIEINHLEDRYWNDKGNFLAKLGRIDESLKCFDKAMELSPNDNIILCNKAFVYLENEGYDKALEYYDKACEMDSEDIHPLIGKSNVYMATGDFYNAGKCFDLAREIDDEDPEYLTNYGHFLLVQERFDEAIESWDKCIEMGDESAMLWIFKAMAYVGLENDTMFEVCVAKACQLDPMIMYALDDIFDEE